MSRHGDFLRLPWINQAFLLSLGRFFCRLPAMMDDAAPLELRNFDNLDYHKYTAPTALAEVLVRAKLQRPRRGLQKGLRQELQVLRLLRSLASRSVAALSR